LNWNSGDSGGSILLFALCGEMCLLLSCCVGDRCGVVGSDEDRGRSRRPGADERGWSSTGRILGGRITERSADMVCGLHH
jgi:hypothetical protein